MQTSRSRSDIAWLDLEHIMNKNGSKWKSGSESRCSKLEVGGELVELHVCSSSTAQPPRVLVADGQSPRVLVADGAAAACARPPRRLGAGGGVVRASLLAARGGEAIEFCD